MSRAALIGALRATQRAQEHAHKHPLTYVRWRPWQEEYLACASPRKLLRLGNGPGKSWVALADVELRAEKRHPYRPDWNARPGPQHQWIVTVSWSQSIPLQRTFREFIDWDRVLKAPNWDPARGWGKDAPTIVYKDGSTVGWRTMRQGPLAMAGAFLDHALIDEPCAVEHFREIERRVYRRAGEVSLALTPVNAPGDLSWLRKMAEDGIVEDLNWPMTEALFRYADGSLHRLPDGTICNADWIEEQMQNVPARWREIVINGGWEELAVDAAFAEVFSRTKHVARVRIDRSDILLLGIDHGTRAFTETAVLMAVDESTEYPTVAILDCYEAPEASPPEDDARGILAMLGRHSLKWGDLKHAKGDIEHYGGRRGKWSRKSNAELASALSRELRLGRYQALNPPIHKAKSGKGSDPRSSVYRGIGWLHRALRREGQITIDPRAESVIQAFEKYKGGSTDPHGHLMDAVRYGLDYYISRGQTRTGRPVAVHIG